MSRSKSKRRQYTPEQKVAILREHLLEKKPISEVCEAHGVNVSLFYDWQKKFFENGAAAFQAEVNAEQRRLERQVETLQNKLDHKDRVIAAVTEEFIRAKKANGEP
jgi:transposase